MKTIAGITLGLAIMAGPTSAAVAAETSAGHEKVIEVASSALKTETDSSSSAPEVAGQFLVTTAWAMSGVTALVGVAFLPSVITRSNTRRRSRQENQTRAAKIEETIDSSIQELKQIHEKLVTRLDAATEKYGEKPLVAARLCSDEAANAIYVVQALKDSLPVKNRSLEESEIRLGAVEAVADSIANANRLIKETDLGIDFVVDCEKEYVEESTQIDNHISELRAVYQKMLVEYGDLEKHYDFDYIAGAKAESDLMIKHIESADEAATNLRTWLERHDLESASKSLRYAKTCLESANGSYRAFKSRYVAINTFDLSRDAAISGVIAELDANIPENRAEGMARVIGDARIAVKNIRRLDTKSGNPATALEELMLPVTAYRNSVEALRRKKATTETMKKSVFSAMDEAAQKKEALLAEMKQYHIIPTPEERSALERIDAAILHTFTKIKFDAKALPFFDVERTAVWSGNALSTIMKTNANASSLKARIAEAKAKEAAEKEAARKRKAAADKKRKEEQARRRKRRNSSSSYGGMSSGYSYGGDY
jgi:hypothetical protein